MSKKEISLAKQRQLFEKGYIEGDNLYKLALYKGWSEEQVQKIVAIIDKYVEIEKPNERRKYITERRYNKKDFEYELSKANIRKDEDIFLILLALCQKDMDRYFYFAQDYLPSENKPRLRDDLCFDS